MKLLLTCGGTAGHVYPAVALARVFQEHDPDCGILFVGAENGMEGDLVSKEGYEMETVKISNFRRSLSPKQWGHNLKSAWNVAASRRRAKEILKEFRPDLVVGTGGYASYPAVRQAARMGIPTAVHESNASPGLTTRTLAREVDRILVGFEEAVSQYEDPGKVRVTGTPVRPEFFRLTREEARAALGIPEGRPLVLSFWGSLGATAMNEIMVDFIARWEEDGRPFDLIQGAGRDFEKMRGSLQDRKISPEDCGLRQYIYNMPEMMTAADLVLCRSGASTLSELTATGTPAVLVPSPNVTANHQYKNARVLSDRGGALLMEEKDCSGETLYDAVTGLLNNKARREQMSREQASLSVPDAAEQIYQILMELLASS